MAWAFPKAAASTLCFLSTSDSYLASNLANRSNSCPTKSREVFCAETPTISTITAIPGSTIKLHGLSVKAQATTLAASENILYMTKAITQQPKAVTDAAMATETLFESEEAVIAAAGAQAMALAKAAVRAAKDAVEAWAETQIMAECEGFPSEADWVRLERARLTEMERLGSMKTLGEPEPITEMERLGSMKTLGEPEPTVKGLDLKCGSISATPMNIFSETEQESALNSKDETNIMLVSQNTERVSARSRRQLKSKARKAKLSIETTNVGSEIICERPLQMPKKSTVHSVDFSNRLHHLQPLISPRLTDAEEAEFSRGIQDLLKLERIRARIEEKTGREPTISQWAEAAQLDRQTLERKIWLGQHCRDEIVNSSRRLVISVAKMYQGRGVSLQDLIQEGSLGLLRGAEKFDYKRGFKFSTYVHWWIRQSVRRAVAKQSRTIRLPVYIFETFSRIREAKVLLHQKLGRYPKDAEVADLLGLSISRVRFVMKCSRFTRSIDQHIGRDDNRTLGELTADPDVEGPETTVTRELLKQDIDKVLETLRPREKEVLRLRFGLDDGTIKSRNEVGHLFSLSRERIRQIEGNALRKLKQTHINNDLKHYLGF